MKSPISFSLFAFVACLYLSAQASHSFVDVKNITQQVRASDIDSQIQKVSEQTNKLKHAVFSVLVPHWNDFWEDAQNKYKTAIDNTQTMVSDIAKDYKTSQIVVLKDHMLDVVESTKLLHTALTSSDIPISEISARISVYYQAVLNEMERTFPPPDKAPSHHDRQVTMNSTLTMAGDVLIQVCADTFNLPPGVVKPHWDRMRGGIYNVLVVTGDLIEQHPVLVPYVLFTVAALLLPEMLLLRPILSLFGFGPYGPVKGTVASWSQRYFWGAAVESKSWFAMLQRAGMTGQAGKIIPTIGVGLVGLGALFACRRDARAL